MRWQLLCRRLCPDDRLRHCLELGLGLGQLGKWFAVGDDSAACVEVGRAAIVTELGATNRHREDAVSVSVEPADRPAVARALEALDPLDQVDCSIARMSPERGRRRECISGVENV